MDERESTGQASAQEDTYDLYITFVGLHMFVEDDHHSSGGKRLHVLMPRTGTSSGHGGHEGHSGHVHDPHLATLLFRKDQNAPVPDPSTGSHIAEKIDLSNRQLDLTGLVTRDTLHLNFPQSDVFDLSAFHGDRSVGRHLVEGGGSSSDPNECAARITLSVGRVHQRKRGALWNMGNHGPMHMAITVQWKIKNVEGDSLKLELQPLNRLGRSETITLNAINREIWIWVYHSPKVSDQVPPNDHACKEPPADQVKHFLAFYDLLPPVGVTPRWGNCAGDSTTLTFPRTSVESNPEYQAGATPETRSKEPGIPALPSGAKGLSATAEPPSDEHADKETTARSGDEVACIAVTAKAGA